MTKNIVPWESLETEELAQTLSDYHKDVHGFRPRYVDMTDRAEILHQLRRLDQRMEYLESTPAGRQILKSENWI